MGHVTWDTPEPEYSPVVGGETKLLYVDIDKTLIHPFNSEEESFETDAETVLIEGICYRVLRDNVYKVQRFEASDGVEVVFWSAGGAYWALQVCIALGIDGLGSAFLSKPSWYLDDVADAGFATHADKFIDATKTTPSFK